jgi:hypothetical protein
MVLELYTLGDIKRLIRNEFNLASNDPEVDSFLAEQINKAHRHIAKTRGRWHWQLKEAVLDIPDRSSVVCTATKGSREITLDSILSGSAPIARNILVVGSSDYGTQGYMVESVDGATITLSRQWLHATGQHTLTSQVGYVALPADFYAINTADEMSNIAGNYLRYFDNQRFQFVRNKSQISINTDRIYTALGDPLNVDRSVRYLAFYPYYGTMDTLFYSYYYVPAQLVDDNDEPILPVGDRPVLVDFALWFVAQAKGYEKVLLYRDMALDGLNAMMHHKDEDATHNFDEVGDLTLDLSATRGHEFGMDSDYSPTIV